MDVLEDKGKQLGGVLEKMVLVSFLSRDKIAFSVLIFSPQ